MISFSAMQGSKWFSALVRKMKAEGFVVEADRLDAGQCPFCGRDLQAFKDDLSLQEFQVTGLCQRCQDEIFEPEHNIDGQRRREVAGQMMDALFSQGIETLPVLNPSDWPGVREAAGEQMGQHMDALYSESVDPELWKWSKRLARKWEAGLTDEERRRVDQNIEALFVSEPKRIPVFGSGDKIPDELPVPRVFFKIGRVPMSSFVFDPQSLLYDEVHGRIWHWLIPVGIPNTADYIYRWRAGYDGPINLRLTLRSGKKVLLLKGFRSDASALYKDTGLDFRSLHASFLVIGLESYSGGEIGPVIYRDIEPMIGSADRADVLTRKFSNSLQERVYFYEQSPLGVVLRFRDPDPSSGDAVEF